MAASGTQASQGAATATPTSSSTAASTPASGVRAPASRCGTDRFSEPQATKHEKKGPVRLASP